MTNRTMVRFANEEAFQQTIITAAKHLRVEVFHPYDSRRSTPGFPDLVLLGARGVLYRELKTEKGRPTAHQQWWLDSLTEAGQDAGIWRPSDWPEPILTALRDLGGTRTRPPGPSAAAVRKRLASKGLGHAAPSPLDR